MTDDILEMLMDLVDEYREKHGPVLDFHHVDETTKLFFVIKTPDIDSNSFKDLKEALKEEAPPYKLGVLVGHVD